MLRACGRRITAIKLSWRLPKNTRERYFNRMIRNVIFDMGGVLIQFDREYFIRKLGVAAEDEQILMNEVFRSLEWARLDRGSITEPDAIAAMCERLPRRLHAAAADLVSRWDLPIRPMEGMAELAKELKDGGYGVYLLSNAFLRQREYWPRIPLPNSLTERSFPPR